jgi:hypothetical protein
MKSLQNQYKLITEGKGEKDIFLKEAKRLYPNLLTNSSNFREAETILKNKGVISENIVSIPAIGNLKDESKKDWIKIFEENVKADETKTSKEVEDINAHGYNNADKNNLNNQIFDQYLNGLYVELKKDPELTMEKAREIVAKNLASDSLYYMKNAAFKVDGIGYTDEAPGLTPKEITGKYKSSGYGDLKENKSTTPKIGDVLTKNGRKGKVVKVMDDMVNVDFGNGDVYGITLSRIRGSEIINEQKLRKIIRSIIKEELKEDHTPNPNDKYEVKYSSTNDTWQVWEGDFLVTDFATKERAQAYANRKNREQGLNEYRVSDRFYSYEDAVEHAKAISKNQGVVQHVNEIPGSLEDSYVVSDWYDEDATLISFENGRQL